MTRDWVRWHEDYDRDTPLRRRLFTVRRHLEHAITSRPDGLIQVVSMCAGDGRDVLPVVRDHPRRSDVRVRLVELDERLADRAARAAGAMGLADVEVVVADAGTTSAYVSAVPADVVLVSGVFGHVPEADIRRTIHSLPSLCRSGAQVLWTRHRRPPDRTPDVREWLRDAGFSEVTFRGGP